MSQYLIRHVQYDADHSDDDLFFRTLLFKIFNKVETWEFLSEELGEIRWSSYSFDRLARALDRLRNTQSIYSGAYIMPSPRLGHPEKHRNHLRLLEQLMKQQYPQKIRQAHSLGGSFDLLLEVASFGKFLAFQFAIDLNYSELCDFEEHEHVVAGPGAHDGISKCFVDTGGLSSEDVIRAVADSAEGEFRRLDLNFCDLWGRAPQLIDWQNVFCEVSKYSRATHPEIQGKSGRTRIKQKYRPANRPLPQWYPPKWGIQLPRALAS